MCHSQGLTGTNSRPQTRAPCFRQLLCMCVSCPRLGCKAWRSGFIPDTVALMPGVISSSLTLREKQAMSMAPDSACLLPSSQPMPVSTRASYLVFCPFTPATSSSLLCLLLEQVMLNIHSVTHPQPETLHNFPSAFSDRPESPQRGSGGLKTPVSPTSADPRAKLSASGTDGLSRLLLFGPPLPI